MQRRASKLAEELADGSKIIPVGQRLPEMVDLIPTQDSKDRGGVQFEEIYRSAEAFEWGTEVLIVQRVNRIGVLAARRLRKAARAGR